MIRSEPLKRGSIVEGVVKSLTKFGAFIDLGGIDALLHISQISHKRIQHPIQLLFPGQVLRVIVLNIDQSKKRIRVGRKQLLKPEDVDDVGKPSAKEIRRLKKSAESFPIRLRAPSRKKETTDAFERASRIADKVTLVRGGLPSLGKQR